jgi:transposase
VRAFAHLGGGPQRLTYDNLGAAVRRVLEGHTRGEQQAFMIFRSHYLFDSRFRTPGRRPGMKKAVILAVREKKCRIKWTNLNATQKYTKPS